METSSGGGSPTCRNCVCLFRPTIVVPAYNLRQSENCRNCVRLFRPTTFVPAYQPKGSHESNHACRCPLRHQGPAGRKAPDPQGIAGQSPVADPPRGICGTDVHYFQEGRFGNFAVTALILGHEVTGEVVAVGEGVEQPAVARARGGESVPPVWLLRLLPGGAGQPLPAGADVRHARQATHRRGFLPISGAARNSALPSELEIDDALAAMMEPFAVALHASRRAVPRRQAGPGDGRRADRPLGGRGRPRLRRRHRGPQRSPRGPPQDGRVDGRGRHPRPGRSFVQGRRGPPHWRWFRRDVRGFGTSRRLARRSKSFAAVAPWSRSASFRRRRSPCRSIN